MDSFFDAKCKLSHIAFSLREKGLSLVKINSWFTFIGLGVAPLMILSGVLIKNATILPYLIGFAGFLSLGNWAWSISRFVFKTDKHIDFCKTLPVKIEVFLQKTESNVGNRIDTKQMLIMSDECNKYLLTIKEKIEEEHFTVPDWINIKAEQHVLSTLGATCASCSKKWETSGLLQKREIKKHLRRKYAKLYCHECGQRFY